MLTDRWLSLAGREIGNWNDRTARGDTRAELGRRWRVLDRIASWLYRRDTRRKKA